MHLVAFVLYNGILAILLLLLAPYYSILFFLNHNKARRFWRRFSIPLNYTDRFESSIVIHAASAGEVKLAGKLVSELRSRGLKDPIVLTTETHSGKLTAQNKLSNQVAKVLLLPFDFTFLMKQVVKLTSPYIFIVIEANITPNLLKIMASNHVKIVMVNGWLGKKNLQFYKFIPGLLPSVLSFFDIFGVQSQSDMELLRDLGVNCDKIQVVGDMKFDEDNCSSYSLGKETKIIEWFQVLGDSRVIVFGSTHVGEEKQIFNALLGVWNEFPDVVAIIAPRNLQRIGKIVTEAKRMGIPVCLRSELKEGIQKSRRVIILDCMGELSFIYSLATVTFVGGTLVPVGGHNLLEPLVHGKPVLFGPYYSNNQFMANVLASEGVGYCVHSDLELQNKIIDLIYDRRLLEQISKRAQELFISYGGATQRSAAIINNIVGSCSYEVNFFND